MYRRVIAILLLCFIEGVIQRHRCSDIVEDHDLLWSFVGIVRAGGQVHALAFACRQVPDRHDAGSGSP